MQEPRTHRCNSLASSLSTWDWALENGRAGRNPASYKRHRLQSQQVGVRGELVYDADRACLSQLQATNWVRLTSLPVAACSSADGAAALLRPVPTARPLGLPGGAACRTTGLPVQ